jgi:hypothetical protein
MYSISLQQFPRDLWRFALIEGSCFLELVIVIEAVLNMTGKRVHGDQSQPGGEIWWGKNEVLAGNFAA